MQLKRIDHVGVVVNDLAEATRFVKESFGLEISQKIDRADLQAVYLKCGDASIELIYPTDEAVRTKRLGDGQQARIEHIAIEVGDLGQTLAVLEGLGLRSTAPPRISGGALTFFTSPESSGGVMYQFMQPLDQKPASLKTTDLCDQYGAELQVCAPVLRHYGKVRQFNGPIATVKVYEDNVLVKEALQTVPAGSVLVVDGGGSLRCALVGDMLAAIAVERGLAGIIVNGCIRDAADIAGLNVGVMALATNPLRSSKAGVGQRDLPVHFGGVKWAPGQWAYADDDGIVVADRPLHQ